jgi:hypothetical protein
LDKGKPKPLLLFVHDHVFGTDALYIRTENMVGARSAQWPRAEIGGRRGINRAVAIELVRTTSPPRKNQI